MFGNDPPCYSCSSCGNQMLLLVKIVKVNGKIFLFDKVFHIYYKKTICVQ